jgi:hypothetical protein
MQLQGKTQAVLEVPYPSAAVARGSRSQCPSAYDSAIPCEKKGSFLCGKIIKGHQYNRSMRSFKLICLQAILFLPFDLLAAVIMS